MHLVIEADDAAHGHQLDEAVVQGVHLQQRVRVGLHERCNNGSSSSNSSSSSSSSSSRVRGVDSGSVYCKQSGVLTVGRRIANTNTYLTQTKKITRTIRTLQSAATTAAAAAAAAGHWMLAVNAALQTPHTTMMMAMVTKMTKRMTGTRAGRNGRCKNVSSHSACVS